MFSYINGKITYLGENFISLENNGIGYKVLMSTRNISNLLINEDHKIYTELIVREDGMYMYGFSSMEDLEMFLSLNTVTSIGPKVSLGILSSLTTYEIKKAILSNDIKTLTLSPGVGKKTASRIILELSDKIDIDSLMEDQVVEINSSKNDNYDFALEALLNLGFTKQDAVKKLGKINFEEMELSDIIKIALKN